MKVAITRKFGLVKSRGCSVRHRPAGLYRNGLVHVKEFEMVIALPQVGVVVCPA